MLHHKALKGFLEKVREEWLDRYYGRFTPNEFDLKPLACNSPHMEWIKGKLHRVHYGGDYRSGRLEPSVWSEDATHNVFPRKEGKLYDLTKI